MTLRTVTIWTTGAMLIGTIIAPYIASPFVYGLSIYGDIGSPAIPILIMPFIIILRGLFLWLFSGSTLGVSFIIAVKLKHAIPLFILLVSTVVYGFWYVYWWNMAMTGGSCMDGMFVLYIVPGSLLFLIPTWVITLLLDSRYVTKTP